MRICFKALPRVWSSPLMTKVRQCSSWPAPVICYRKSVTWDNACGWPLMWKGLKYVCHSIEEYSNIYRYTHSHCHEQQHLLPILIYFSSQCHWQWEYENHLLQQASWFMLNSSTLTLQAAAVCCRTIVCSCNLRLLFNFAGLKVFLLNQCGFWHPSSPMLTTLLLNCLFWWRTVATFWSR